MKKNKYLQEHPQVRTLLRVIGFIALIIGIALVVSGYIGVFKPSSSNPFDYDPEDSYNKSSLIFIGMPLIFVGLACLGYGFMGAVSRYQASEISPVVKDTTNYLLSGTKDEVAGLVSRIKDDKSLICLNCGDKNDIDALYCDNCGRKLRKTCSCGEINKSDSKYCKRCGNQL